MNRLIRMVMNFAMREGVNRGVNWWVSRSGKDLDPKDPATRQMKQNSREQGRNVKRMMRMMRRMFRL